MGAKAYRRRAKDRIISAGNRPHSLKNGIASSTGVPLAPFDSLRSLMAGQPSNCASSNPIKPHGYSVIRRRYGPSDRFGLENSQRVCNACGRFYGGCSDQVKAHLVLCSQERKDVREDRRLTKLRWTKRSFIRQTIEEASSLPPGGLGVRAARTTAAPQRQRDVARRRGRGRGKRSDL